MLRGVETVAASLATSQNPNRHAMAYTPKESLGKKPSKMSPRTQSMNVRLYLTVADNKADAMDRSVIFGGSTPG